MVRRQITQPEHPILKDRAAVKPLGAHTSVGRLHELGRWKNVPYLRDNEGMLPPFIIAVGSRERVAMAPGLLNLRSPVFIDEVARDKVDIRAFGRVSMVIGLFEKAGIEIPVAVVETQMGCSATQINLREMLYFARTDGYVADGQQISSDGIYVVRAGTAAGVNSFSASEVKVGIGDILIATESYGSIGALMQSTLKILGFTGMERPEVGNALRNLVPKTLYPQAQRHGGWISLSQDESHLVTRCSPKVIHHLQLAAYALKLKYLVGPDFSKDSLYAELGELGFAALRDIYGIISSEMEQVTIDDLASLFRRSGIMVFSGLVSAAIGAIPGKSFPETAREKKLAAAAEKNAVLVAANALADIAHDIKAAA